MLMDPMRELVARAREMVPEALGNAKCDPLR
jgi:hypothetical protein